MPELHPESLVTEVTSVKLDVAAGTETLLMKTATGLSFCLDSRLTSAGKMAYLHMLTPCHHEPIKWRNGEKACSFIDRAADFALCPNLFPEAPGALAFPVLDRGERMLDKLAKTLVQSLNGWLDIACTALSPLETPLIVDDLVYDLVAAHDLASSLFDSGASDPLADRPDLASFRDQALYGPVDWTELSSHEMGAVLPSLLEAGDSTLVLSHFEQLAKHKSPHELAPFLKSVLMSAMSEDQDIAVKTANRPRCAALIPAFDSVTKHMAAR